MSKPTANRSRHGLLDVLTAALILAVATAQVLFALEDVRLPRDPGLYFKLLPELYQALAHPLDNLRALSGALAESSGWYNLLLAAAMRMVGRSGLVLDLACAVWVALLLVGTALIARRASSPTAGLCATLLAAAMPVVIIIGRTPWIHVPEAALAVLTLATWQRDPALRRWRTVLALILGGMLVITLRHSGLIWIGPMSLLLFWTGGAPRAWRRIALVLAGWALAVAVPVLELQRYLEAKMGARDRYVSQLPEFVEQLVSNLSWPTLWACLLGIVLFSLRRPRVPRRPLEPLLVVWIVLGVFLWSLFRAGLDNFTPVAPALAILAGTGLARLGRWGVIPAGLAFLVASLPQWLDKDAVRPFMNMPGFPDFTAGTHPNNHYRPWTGFAHAEVRGLLNASCPEDVSEGCVVAVDHGLFSPFTEDPGRLELFLIDEDRVHLISLRDLESMPRLAQLHALATYDCHEREEHWRERYPNTRQILADMLDAFDLHPVWAIDLYRNCSYLWMTPDGELRDEQALPATGRHITEKLEPPRRDGSQPTGGSYLGLPPREGDAPLPAGVSAESLPEASPSP